MKVLITADIHIDDYANYNYSYRSRLNQYENLAHRMVELGKLNDCSELWILGDLIDRPNCRPYIAHKAEQFMRIVCEGFTTVRYILGNHDLDTKSQDLTPEDSHVTILNAKNLVYMDRELMKIDNHLFGFMNWRSEQDLTWLGDAHLDVLFGHYTKSALFGQDIDESKFDLMIHGDIHNSQVIGKFVSVCNPIQKDMSSEREGKVLLFDTETLHYERILVDPDHTRYLQMTYTSDQAEEGFHGPLQYCIFKPELTGTADDTAKVKSFSWNDIDDLVNQACESNNLQSIHQEILANCEDFTEVDFNFQLTYLKIHGYRSIEDLELNFSKGDRIALLGENGSGKSSILRALKGAFGKNSELKYEQSDFTDDVQIELKLIYQNKVYHIKKGSSWGLLIDGQVQPYHGIRDFEADLFIKLPFLDYLDLFFLSATVSNLSMQFNPTRRIELISKFYRLDRLSSYWKTANSRWQEVNTELFELKRSRDVKCGIRDHIRERLSELSEFGSKSRSELEDVIKSYQDLRDRYGAFKVWTLSYNRLKEDEQDIKDKIKVLEARLSFDPVQGRIDLADLKEKEASINTAYEDLYKKSIEFESDLKEVCKVEAEGSALNAKLKSIKQGSCPECGAPLELGKQSKLIEQYTAEKSELTSRWIELDTRLSKHPEGRDSKEYYIKTLSQLKSSYKELHGNIELLNNKISNFEKASSSLETEKSHLSSIQSKLESHLDSKPEEVKLPLDLQDLEFTASANLAKFDEYQKHQTDMATIEEELTELDKNIHLKSDELDNYNRYIELMSNSGIIYEEILRQLADKFTTTQVKYEVEAGVYRGSRYINFNSYYLSKGKYRIYESCSDGQKTVCDLDFLDKLFSVNIGVLTLDEFLAHLDDNNFSVICDTLQSMNVNTIILSTHDGNLTAYNRRVMLKLDEVGRTQAQII